MVLYQLIPQLRQRYCELRQPELLELFQKADEDGSGALSVEELMAVLQRSGFYPQLREDGAVGPLGALGRSLNLR